MFSFSSSQVCRNRKDAEQSKSTSLSLPMVYLENLTLQRNFSWEIHLTKKFPGESFTDFIQNHSDVSFGI